MKYIRNYFLQIKYIRLFNHENIVKYYGSGSENNYVTIIMEYCSNGSLADIIKSRGSEFFSNEEILHYIVGMYNGLSEIHAHGVIHRDIKPHNIFVDEDNTPQIGDFGLSIEIKELTKSKSAVGTENYLSPEILKSREYSYKSDMWALGVVLYELCTFKKPFKNKKEILEKELPDVEGYADYIKEVINGLLTRDPNERKYSSIIYELKKKKDIFRDGMNSMLKSNYDDAMRKFEDSFIEYSNTSMKADIRKNIAYCFFQNVLKLYIQII